MVEDRLWQEKRTIIKPLRYNGEEDLFPDFVLKDVAGVDALHMEVFGMNTPKYLQRNRKKPPIMTGNTVRGGGCPGTLQTGQTCRHFLQYESGVV
ncbi:hypothetical protein [Pantoea ananatis]|uniref:hypothetical protein n=1 Tax=Pantoea ananas TaxID=553 RepID=UPI003FA46478